MLTVGVYSISLNFHPTHLIVLQIDVIIIVMISVWMKSIQRYVLSRNMYLFVVQKQKGQASKQKQNLKDTSQLNNKAFNAHKGQVSGKAKQQMKKLQKKNEIKDQFDWSIYGKDVYEIFGGIKKEVVDLDLAFIAKKIQLEELNLTEQLAERLKQYIKQLKAVDFSLIPSLVELSFRIGLVSPPPIFIKSFLEYYKSNPFGKGKDQIQQFPSYFLKKVAYQVITMCGNRNVDEMASALRSMAIVLSLNQLKKVDELCCEKVQKMSLDSLVRLLNIFRQIRKRGRFVDIAQTIIVDLQTRLNTKNLMMAIISFLELGHIDGYSKLENLVVQKIKANGFSDSETISLVHILHKYKAGNKQIWLQLEGYIIKKYSKIPFEHIFAIMSGFTRNYIEKPQLLVHLIEYQPTLSYAKDLADKQFVQFFFVLYANFRNLPDKSKIIYRTIIKDIIGHFKFKSIYQQLKYFYLYLFETNQSQRKSHLIKAYPDDLMLSLLSLAFKDIQSFNNHEAESYEKQLLTRYQPQIYQQSKQIIIVEEFIRYKLMSIMKDELQQESKEA